MGNLEFGHKEILSPYELARNFESVIKGRVSERFSAISDNLTLLLEDKDGAYWSQEEQGTLCCLVIDQKSGFLYLVTGKLDKDLNSLENLKADIVS